MGSPPPPSERLEGGTVTRPARDADLRQGLAPSARIGHTLGTTDLQDVTNSDDLGSLGHTYVSEPTLGGEINIFDILALEEEIRGYERTMSELKRARALLLDGPTSSQSEQADKTDIDTEAELRALDEQIREQRQPILKCKRMQNSLLNISRIPPEILGYIFWLSSAPEGFGNRSLEFLTVCYGWYEAAICTPGLWNSWGKSLQDWKDRHLLRPGIPLDLVLDGGKPKEELLEASIQNTLRNRADKDAIRSVRLWSEHTELLNSILRALAADATQVRYSSMETFILQKECCTPVDVSKLFENTRFPRLRYLDLTHCTISSLDSLSPETNLLTTLALGLGSPSSTPTAPQLLSLIASNPSLQKLALFGHSLPMHWNEDHPRVSLPQLRELELRGECEDVSMLLEKLVCPDILDHLDITLGHCTVQHILDNIGPYLRDYFRRRGRSQGGMEIHVSFLGGIFFQLGDGGSHHSPTLAAERIDPFLAITITTGDDPQVSQEELFLHLIEHTPRDDIFSLRMSDLSTGSPSLMWNVYTLFPNLKALYSRWIPTFVLFPKPEAGEEHMFPPQSLRHIHLHLGFPEVDWTPLVTFLSSYSHPSSAKRLDFLQITQFSPMCPKVESDIRSSVGEFRLIRP